MHLNRFGFRKCLWIVIFAIIVCAPVIVSAATIIVNDLNDNTTSGNTFCTLREAINNANSDSDTTTGDCAPGSGADTINFSVSGTITLASTLPSITDTTGLTIDAQTQKVTISGNDAVQIMIVEEKLDLNALTLTKALNGALSNFGGTVTITNCTFSDNHTVGTGGAVRNHGTLTIRNSTLAGNRAFAGSAIDNEGTLTLVNCTIAYGGSDNPDLISLSALENGSSSLSMSNTIIAYNEGTCYSNVAPVISVNNFIQFGADCNPTYTGDPKLNGLADNGGPTFTIAPASDSPVIDKYSDAGCGTTITTDQRGFVRPIDGDAIPGALCDIGAFEYGSHLPPEFPCPNGQGYWKNNPTAWPVVLLTLGSHQYTKDQLLVILNLPSKTIKKDASLILAVQLIASKLNVENGADPGPVQQLIDDSDALLTSISNGSLPYNIKPKSATGQQMVALALQLEQYNQRILTPNCQL